MNKSEQSEEIHQNVTIISKQSTISYIAAAKEVLDLVGGRWLAIDIQLNIILHPSLQVVTIANREIGALKLIILIDNFNRAHALLEDLKGIRLVVLRKKVSKQVKKTKRGNNKKPKKKWTSANNSKKNKKNKKEKPKKKTLQKH